jgi:nucleotide-binding universal stress UspA family protein
MEHRAARIADGVSKQLAQDGVSSKPMVQTGSPVGVLIGYSQDYDVVGVSAQSHKGDSAGLGPVASRILEHANASVLLVRAGETGSPLKILIPVDGSDAAYLALDKFQILVDLSASEVTLLHVVETPWIRLVDEQEWFAAEEEPDHEPQSEVELEFAKEAENLTERARARLPARTAVTTMVFNGIPAEDILTEANSGAYNLIVLAATGGRDLKHRILGSVSSKVAWNAPCSILLVHPGDKAS